MGDRWLIVKKAGAEVGVIELRANSAPKLASGSGEAAEELRGLLAKHGGPDGIPLKMHLPPPNGRGRGALGARVITYDDPLYLHALKEKLEPTFDAGEIPRLRAPAAPASLKRIQVSRSGSKVGTVDLTGSAPKVTLATTASDGDFLKSHVEAIQKTDPLRVLYVEDKGGARKLITLEAKPGAADYAHVFAMSLVGQYDYSPDRGYALSYE